MNLTGALILLLVFEAASVFLLVSVFSQKVVNSHRLQKQVEARDFIFRHYLDGENLKRNLPDRFFFDAFIEVENQVQLDPVTRQKITDDILKTAFCHRQFRTIRHGSRLARKQAAFYLHALGTKKAKAALRTQLMREKNASVRFYLANALILDLDSDSFAIVIDSLRGCDEAYRHWIEALFKNHYSAIEKFLWPYFEDPHPSIRHLILYLAQNIFDHDLQNYALKVFQAFMDFEHPIRLFALEALASMVPETLLTDEFLLNPDEEVQAIAIKALATKPSKDTVDFIIRHIDGTAMDEVRQLALSTIVFDSKVLLLYVLDEYKRVVTRDQRLVLARVLSRHLDYVLLKIKDASHAYVTEIIEDLLDMHVVEQIIDFINRNKDEVVEQVVLNIVRRYASSDAYYLDQFSVYLKPEVLSLIGLLPKPQPVIKREKSPKEKGKNTWIFVWSFVGLMFFPILAFFFNLDHLSSPSQLFTGMITTINSQVIFYFLAVNSIYLLLLILSIIGSKQRNELWSIKKATLLFAHDLLPSISIIAPAYNEEKSIIESVTSLLNLKYPKYEVIVVNDGSKDRTIETLIEHFGLERRHPMFKATLNTRALRGVYMCKDIPNLIVIDKQNGGKADALNMGINAARNDYVCGIDADSLLEEEALLKLMSVTLDDSKEHIALGGNIVPVNGCTVDRGKIEKRGLGQKGLVRFQTLEYLRAFTTGRVGWSKMHSLLIISGAFGLFSREALLKTGGYLTVSGQLKKDTVGEDMELVVRLTYEALKEKKTYRVEYVHNANCYTELPSDGTSLFKQRNRWQRGLIDILHYHRNMLFNPRYRQPGMIGFPYFFIFEMMGPFIEIIGYLAFVLGLIFGLLDMVAVIVFLLVTIGYGIVLSLFALYVAEREINQYDNKETGILLLLAFVENFGYRQVISMHRALSTLSALKEKGNWGSQKRQGFTKT